MQALLDVNVLIALLDREHTQHRGALEWFVENAELGWASCPLTENGCLRIVSQPAYPNPVPFRLVESRLGDLTRNQTHVFWPDDLSILDSAVFDLSQGQGPKQLTDIYLLGLAAARNARLVSFDQRISLKAVPAATQQNLLVL